MLSKRIVFRENRSKRVLPFLLLVRVGFHGILFFTTAGVRRRTSDDQGQQSAGHVQPDRDPARAARRAQGRSDVRPGRQRDTERVRKGDQHREMRADHHQERQGPAVQGRHRQDAERGRDVPAGGREAEATRHRAQSAGELCVRRETGGRGGGRETVGNRQEDSVRKVTRADAIRTDRF